ncbi:MAG: Rpn family recombination-promoting nuclease/putative transposase [Candidatus Kapabacteria bacterium]|jgi:predicted transposase/invertase (TIGR01784 family)|nr:Rpn family recombination-promoting nuclease/putative transposase [Candidatus Kapabacteria bacterium]
MLMEKYVNPFTDFGFKKLFGTEVNKDILIDFLNELLKGKEKIKTLSYKSTEFMGITDLDRKAVFDLYCENDSGEKFIVELQKAKQKFFKDRALFYSTFPIQEQARRGSWDFELKCVYTVAILDFIFDDDIDYKDKVVFEVKLSELEHKKVFYDKLTFIYLAMPNFRKQEHELVTKFDKWLYAIKNLPDLEDRPKALQERIFKKFFDSAEIAKFSREENQSYEYSLKVYRDLNNVIDTANEEGFNKGMEKGIELNKIEIVKKMKKLGLSNEIIAETTGLDLESIRKI